MKKLKITFLGLMIISLLSAVSCSRSTDQPEPPEAGLSLEGSWKLTKIDFKGDGVNWNPAVPYNGGTSFGYAPFMLKDMQGYKFGNKKITGDLGFRFDFLYNVNHGENPADETWYWNYLDGGKSFEIMQINPSFPPYNFSITGVKNLKITENGNKIVAEAVVNSRVPGQPITSAIKVPIEFTMERGTPNQDVALYQNGSPYTFPH